MIILLTVCLVCRCRGGKFMYSSIISNQTGFQIVVKSGRIYNKFPVRNSEPIENVSVLKPFKL